MRARIVTVGDELLLGHVANSNATWIAQQLSLLSLSTEEITAVADHPRVIQQTLDRMWSTTDLIIVTGGLGPTDDDITRMAVAEYLEQPLELREDLFKELQHYFQQRKLEMAANNKKLAMVPKGFDVLPNSMGTAPGLWYEREGTIVVLLPGVPQEMKTLMQEQVAPRLEQRTEAYHTYRILRTVGVPESSLQEQLDELQTYTDTLVRVAFLPHLGGVRLRLTAAGTNQQALEERLDRLEAYIRKTLGLNIYSDRDEGLEEVVARLLRSHEVTVATAESCTGGAVVNRLTDVPGASAYMRGGIVAYSNEVKIKQVNVSPKTLESEGAVSSAVARQLASGVRKRLGAHIGVSTTGVAGPSGGTPEKPVGTVWVGYADEEGVKGHLLHLTNDRISNKELTVVAVLDMVRRRLLKRFGRPVDAF